jgi:capsular exopolysaccharide synthesis family protein
VLLVTSTFEGEGKSTVAANLAAAFAEEGKSVVLVDLDLRRPCLSKLFDVPTTGLTNLLLDHNADPEAFLIPTSVANLRVLPSGPIPPNPAPLVSSLRMRHLVDRLRSSADLVILDSPPLLAVTDPVIAGALADGAVVVVRLDRVHRRSLQRAVETLRSRGVDIVGLVVNSLARGHTSAYYAYGYAGYGEREQKRKKVAVAAVAGSNGSEPQA